MNLFKWLFTIKEYNEPTQQKLTIFQQLELKENSLYTGAYTLKSHPYGKILDEQEINQFDSVNEAILYMQNIRESHLKHLIHCHISEYKLKANLEIVLKEINHYTITQELKQKEEEIFNSRVIEHMYAKNLIEYDEYITSDLILTKFELTEKQINDFFTTEYNKTELTKVISIKCNGHLPSINKIINLYMYEFYYASSHPKINFCKRKQLILDNFKCSLQGN
jgi:hypothetical protein